MQSDPPRTSSDSESLPSLDAPWGGGPLTRRDWCMAGLMALLLMAIGWANLTWRGFWIDELFTLRAIRMPLALMIQDRLEAGHLPLYFLFARLGLLFGEAEWQLRLPTLFIGAINLLVLSAVLHLAGLRRLRWPLWLLILSHPYWIWLLTQLRYMMFMLMLIGLATVAWQWWARRPTVARALLLGGAIILLPLSHGTGMLAVGCFAAAMVWQLRANEGGTAPLPWPRALLGAWPAWLPPVCAAPAYLLLNAKHLEVELFLPDVGKLLKNSLEVIFAHPRLWPEALGMDNRGPLDDLIRLAQAFAIVTGIVLGWRALRAMGAKPLARLAMALAVGFPVLFLLVGCFTEGRYTETARYLVAFGVPCLLFFSAAWVVQPSTLKSRRVQRAWQIVLVVLVLVQFPAGLLNRYDRFRETAQWFTSFYRDELLIASVIKPTRTGLQYYGGRDLHQNMKTITEKQVRPAREMLRDYLKVDGRLYFFLYHSQIPMEQAIEDLFKRKVVVGVRYWRINEVLRVGAIISREEHRPWLEAIPEPPRLWGPARKDFD